MVKLEKKTFDVPASWSREQLRNNILRGLVFLAGEVQGYAYREAYDWVQTHYDDGDEIDDYLLYDSCKCTAGMKREDRGIVTRHGIINSLHCYNDHAANQIKNGNSILDGVELYHDPRGGKYAHDYYFKTAFPSADGDDFDFASLYWVLNSRRVTKLLDYYDKLCDPNCPMPKKLII